MEHRRLTLFAGHYGSGKTSLAIRYALELRKAGESVAIADLDIVNPYFRTKDHEETLRAAGIDLICSAFAGSNLDVPAMPPEVYDLIRERDRCGVLDIGGYDRGALALGRYVGAIREEDDYEMLFVANFSRPLTRTPGDAMDVMREVETACGLPFTGIVNNTNLGIDTAAEDVLASLPKAEALCRLSGLPLRFTSYRSALGDKLKDKLCPGFPLETSDTFYPIQTEVYRDHA